MREFFKSHRILAVALSILAGCWTYCLIIAPVLSDQPYWETASEKAAGIGMQYTIAVFIAGVIWLIFAKFLGRKQ